MDDKNITIPYFAHEGITARQERTIKRMWILCILLVVMLVATNAAWIYYESQFQDVVTVTQESFADDGGNAIVNNGGTTFYGEGKANNN